MVRLQFKSARKVLTVGLISYVSKEICINFHVASLEFESCLILCMFEKNFVPCRATSAPPVLELTARVSHPFSVSFVSDDPFYFLEKLLFERNLG
jgi:hypothetical protein